MFLFSFFKEKYLLLDLPRFVAQNFLLVLIVLDGVLGGVIYFRGVTAVSAVPNFGCVLQLFTGSLLTDFMVLCCLWKETCAYAHYSLSHGSSYACNLPCSL